MTPETSRVFLHLAQSGNLTATAQALGYTQSGVSHILKALEAECGLTLMYRGRKGARLTPAGEHLLPYFRSLCRAEEALLAEAQSLLGLERGLLRVGSVPSLSACLLPELLGRFRRQYPGIQIQLRHGEYKELAQWLLEGELDCAFLAQPVPASLATRPLMEDRIVAVLPRDHPLAGRERLRGEELRAQPFIRFEEGWDTELRDVLKAMDLEPEEVLTVQDDYAILAMVEHGLGISVLPELILTTHPYQVAVRELDPPARRQLVFAWRREETPLPALTAFRRVVDGMAGQSPGEQSPHVE